MQQFSHSSLEFQDKYTHYRARIGYYRGQGSSHRISHDHHDSWLRAIDCFLHFVWVRQPDCAIQL